MATTTVRVLLSSSIRLSRKKMTQFARSIATVDILVVHTVYVVTNISWSVLFYIINCTH